MDSGDKAEKIDLRVVKTREAIRAAFERLLETTEYPDITVSDIAREARISRKTFYSHYASVDELLRTISRQTIEEVAAEIQPEGELLTVEDWLKGFAAAVLTTLRNNPHLNGHVLQCLPAAAMLKILREPLIDLCHSELDKRGLALPEDKECCIPFFIGGLCTVYEAWKVSELDPESLDQAGETVAMLVSHGMSEIVTVH